MLPNKIILLVTIEKCFHMVVQGTQKMVVMSHINSEDQTLIKRWRVGKKMNVMGGKLKDGKTQGNH